VATKKIDEMTTSDMELDLKMSEEEKLEELKKKVIDFWINKTINIDKWKEYVRRNDWEWIEREGLNTLLREETFEKVVEKRRNAFWRFVLAGFMHLSVVE